MKKSILMLACIILAITSCTKDKETTPATTTQNPGPVTDAGYGHSNQPFSGNKWQLPAGVQLQDSIHEYSYCWAFPPYTQQPYKDWRGVPFGFSFCFTLSNNTSQPIIVQFPPELVFTSSNLENQNILVIQIGHIELPPQSSKFLVAQGFCINQGRHIPQPYDDNGNFLSYSFGPYSIPTALQQVVDIIKTKNITMADVLNPDGSIDNDKTAKYAIIQQAIWEVTDGEGLSTETKNKLLAL